MYSWFFVRKLIYTYIYMHIYEDTYIKMNIYKIQGKSERETQRAIEKNRERECLRK